MRGGHVTVANFSWINGIIGVLVVIFYCATWLKAMRCLHEDRGVAAALYASPVIVSLLGAVFWVSGSISW